jgi:hypothetical protein
MSCKLVASQRGEEPLSMEAVKGFHIVGNRNLATASGENWGNLANSGVRSRVRELTKAL